MPDEDHRCHAGAAVAGLAWAPVIVDSAVYRKGERVPLPADGRDFAALLAEAAKRDGFVWVGLADPTEAELAPSRRLSSCTRSRSRTPSTRTSARSSTVTRTACS